jgi:DNA ligase (NAD+)
MRAQEASAETQAAAARHQALVREIEAHDYRYYVLDDPVASDAEYDALMRELRAIEASHPELRTAASPTARVAGEVRTGVAKVKHAVRMFSLDNAYSHDELAEFVRRVRDGLPEGTSVEFCVEPKLDGASVELVYDGGTLVEASTRGDGEVGEDITTNVRTIRGVPMNIAHRGRLTLRGEVVFFRAALESLNAERAAAGLEPFANARNAAAGSVRMMDSGEVRKRPLRAVAYQAVEGSKLHATHAETLDWLASLGIPTHRMHVVVGADGLVDAITAIDAARASYPFETDGAVVKVNAYRQQDVLGATSKFPRWAVAYKFKAERAETRVRDILVQVGRTGALTPVAVLDPVPIAGTVVSRASLHNADQIAALDVRIGDVVFIEKAGEIIPQVVAVATERRTGEERPFQMPTACPECGSSIASRLREADRPELGREAVQRCENRDCPAQIRNQIFYFARRFAMDIDHLGVVLVEQLVGRGIVKDVADLYTLTAAQIADLERMGDKSAQNVYESIQRSRERTLDRLLCGLGIPQIGQVAAKQLAEEVHSLDSLLGWDEAHLREHVASIRGFGPKMVDSVVQFVRDARQRMLLEKLRDLGVGRPQPKPVVATEGPLIGQSFCVTGVLSRKREDVHEAIRAAGGEVHDSVKKTTTYLVAGDKTGKSKLDQAKKYGTKVIDEPALEALLAGAAP